MVKTLLLILLLIFAVWGLCEFVYILRIIFFYPTTRINNYSLIVLKEKSAVKQLNYIWQKIRWNGDAFAVGIIAVTDCLDVNEILNCRKFIDNKKIYLCTTDTLLQCTALQGELFDGNDWQ